MRLDFVIATTVAFLLPILNSAEYRESPFLKSFEELQRECAGYQGLSSETVQHYANSGYPDDECVRELVHCIVFAMNAWNETTGIKDHVIRQFFEPSSTDVKSQDRTEDCLRENVNCLSIRDQVGRTYKSFLCYYREFGNIVLRKAQFVPYTNAIRKRLYEDAFCIKNLPRNVLRQFAAGDILNNEYFGLVYYTYTLRAGFYDSESGVNFARTFVQFGNPEILSEQTRCCVASVRRQYQEEPKRIAETFKQCFLQILPSLDTIQKAAQELIEKTPESVVQLTSPAFCSRCGSLAPCKTCGVSDTPGFRPCYNGQCF